MKEAAILHTDSPVATTSSNNTAMSSTMKAAIWTAYGAPEVLQVRTIAKPVPKDNEILIKIHAATVNSGDVRMRKADPFAIRFVFGLFKPKKNILGNVLSGEVEAVGKNVRKFKVGDAVFGSTRVLLGAHAEYLCLPETAPLALKPANLSHEEASALPFGGMTAWHFLQKAHILPGQKVLIYGASGSVGTAAVQLAKYLGAEVTGVCSTANVDLVKSLGADQVIDYTKTDFSKTGTRYDVVFETVGKVPISACAAVLKKGGALILSAALLGGMLKGLWISATSSKKAIFGVTSESAEAAEFLQQRVAAGELKAVIDKIFPLDDIAAAHAHVDKGHKKGNVVVKIA